LIFFLSAPSDILFYQHRTIKVKTIAFLADFENDAVVGKKQEIKYIIKKRAVSQ